MSQLMTGGEAIAQSLLVHGVDTVFAIPGVQTYHLFDAFARADDRSFDGFDGYQATP